jgi:hypothetical protein
MNIDIQISLTFYTPMINVYKKYDDTSIMIC